MPRRPSVWTGPVQTPAASLLGMLERRNANHVPSTSPTSTNTRTLNGMSTPAMPGGRVLAQNPQWIHAGGATGFLYTPHHRGTAPAHVVVFPV
jgi:hypothetical protein